MKLIRSIIQWPQTIDCSVCLLSLHEKLLISHKSNMHFAGKGLVGEGAQESSNVTFDTVEKVSKRDKRSGPLLPVFKADASKITIKGMGLKKAFLGKQNQFQVNCSEAG